VAGKLALTLEKVAELRTMLGDADPDLIHDTLEGETDVFEIMNWLLGKIGDEDAMQEAIATRVAALKERSKASEGRVARLRGALEACMTASGEKSLRLPEATVTIGWKKPGIALIDEAVLPEAFWKVKREVSRSAINESLGRGEVVPGVTLDNGGQTLTVRRK
jgi:hypothetical protein